MDETPLCAVYAADRTVEIYIDCASRSTMSIAERTREAVRERPFLYEALRAGIVNYTAAARVLDVGDDDAVTAALRRYAAELADKEHSEGGSARVRMESGLERGDEEDGVLVVGEAGFTSGEGNLTAILATGELALTDAQRVFGRCAIAEVDVEAAGFTRETLVLVVGRRDGPDALRLVEAVLESE